MKNVCIVEDDQEIREMETYALNGAGFNVSAFGDAAQFFKSPESKNPELVILDIMLPEMDGIAVLKRLRADPLTKKVPVMMVTALGKELDKVKGLDFGADDYLAKPFGVMEFLARVKALLRRSAPETKTVQELIHFETIEINDPKHSVTVAGAPCELTFKEYELLKLLCMNPDRVFSRDQIMEKVWGLDFPMESRTVDMHVKTLRKKLGTAGDYIATVRGVGYKATAQGEK
jgi:two-component system alkaline phosphatase synthesis response regulator PhoP